MGIIIASQIDSIRTLKDGTLKLSLECQELPSKDMSDLFQLKGLIKVYLSSTNIEKDIISNIDDLVITEEGQKSESQRMRAVLYRLWESKPEGYDTFNDFYKSKMEKIINHIKDKI
jgi:hypothetical protein